MKSQHHNVRVYDVIINVWPIPWYFNIYFLSIKLAELLLSSFIHIFILVKILAQKVCTFPRPLVLNERFSHNCLKLFSKLQHLINTHKFISNIVYFCSIIVLDCKMQWFNMLRAVPELKTRGRVAHIFQLHHPPIKYCDRQHHIYCKKIPPSGYF